MYIFLDESKALHKKWWKFILAGLITDLNHSTIDNIYKNFLEYIWVKEKWGEIKSFDKKYRWKIDNFYKYIKSSKYNKNIQFIWVFVQNYNESWDNYYSSLVELIYHTQKYSHILKNNFEFINIIADNLKLDYKEEYIKKLLNSDEKILNKKNKWFKFTFGNSKRYWWIKFADFIAWKLRETYINKKNEIDSDFIEYFVNNEISFIILE